MFSQVSLCPRGGCLSHCMLGYPPRQTPPLWPTPPQADTPIPWADTPLCSVCWDTVNKRAVRIPVECILVTHYFREFTLKSHKDHISFSRNDFASTAYNSIKGTKCIKYKQVWSFSSLTFALNKSALVMKRDGNLPLYSVVSILSLP